MAANTQQPLPPNSGANATSKIKFSPVNQAIILGFAYSQFKEHREEGMSRISSAAHTAFDLILPEFLGWKTHAFLQLTSALPKAAIEQGVNMAQTVRQYEQAARDQSPFRNQTFVDSQQIYTMRQAGLALAEQSKYALQQTLMGNEARYMHR
ncbi:MAG: hypothetical protein J6U54_03930 [Clostridiales bacterium]|nr:hypothetical protein [Clostridiales bacterium]